MATSQSFEVVVDGNVHGGNYATREEAERAAGSLRSGAAQGKNVVIRESQPGAPGQGAPAPQQTQQNGGDPTSQRR